MNVKCPQCQKVLDSSWYEDGSETCNPCRRWVARQPPFLLPTRSGTVIVVAIAEDGSFTDDEGCRWNPVAGSLGFYDALGEESLANQMEPTGPAGTPSSTPRERHDPKSFSPPRELGDLERAAEGDG